ncbi:TerD family protein, partial [Streptomyces palmae]
MTAELVRGQNHPLPQTRLEIRVSATTPVVAGATLGDQDGTVAGTEWVAHPAAPQLPGVEVSRQAAADHRLAVDLGALPETIHRVSVLLALPIQAGGPQRFGGLPAPSVSVTGLDGTPVAGYTITDLESESAVVALELYRRQGAWKVRAVGQGYAGGLVAMLQDQGLPQAVELAARIQDAIAQGMARSVAQPPPRTGEDGRPRTTAGGATDSAAASGDTPRPAGGPIDYQHPGRRTSAPPAPAPA